MTYRSAAFFRDVYRFAPRLTLTVVAFVFVGGLLEGATILLFLPFFATLTAGSSDTTGLANTLVGWMPANVSGTSLLLATCAAFLAVICAKAVVLRKRDMTNFLLAIGFADDLRVSLLSRLAHAPWPDVADLNQADVENALVTETERVKAATLLLGTTLVDVALIVSQALIVIFLAPILGLICIGLILLVGLYLRSNLGAAGLLGRGVSVAGNEIHKVSTDLMQNLKTAKGQNLEAAYVRYFQDAVTSSRTSHIGFKSYELWTSSLLQVVMAFLAVAILLVGILVMQIDVAIVLLMIIALGRLTPTVFRMSKNAQILNHLLPAYQNLRELVERFPDPVPATANPAMVPANGHPILSFQDVFFRYGDDQVTLKDVSFTVDRGEFVGIIGASGAGKSTLMDLALGLQQPQGGQVLHFGKAATAETARGFRERAAYIPQETFLHNMTIRENLMWGSNDVTSQDIETALQVAGADTFVRQFERGLDTPVRDRGAGLSGGERQRISLVQALLRNPDVLMLDEALGANSQDTLHEILARLRSQSPDLAVLYITHRMSDLAAMDRVLMLSEGGLRAMKVADIGVN